MHTIHHGDSHNGGCSMMTESSSPTATAKSTAPKAPMLAAPGENGHAWPALLAQAQANRELALAIRELAQAQANRKLAPATCEQAQANLAAAAALLHTCRRTVIRVGTPCSLMSFTAGTSTPKWLPMWPHRWQLNLARLSTTVPVDVRACRRHLL